MLFKLTLCLLSVAVLPALITTTRLPVPRIPRPHIHQGISGEACGYEDVIADGSMYGKKLFTPASQDSTASQNLTGITLLVGLAIQGFARNGQIRDNFVPQIMHHATKTWD